MKAAVSYSGIAIPHLGGDRCPRCGQTYHRGKDKNHPKSPTRDHILPEAWGGHDEMYISPGTRPTRNLRICCRECNVRLGLCGHCPGALACVTFVAKSSKTSWNAIYKHWRMHFVAQALTRFNVLGH